MLQALNSNNNINAGTVPYGETYILSVDVLLCGAEL